MNRPLIDPVCCNCYKQCSVIELETPWNADGGQLGYMATTVVLSGCCRAGCISQEEDIAQSRRYSDREDRGAWRREIAQQARHEALRQGRAWRGGKS